MELSTPPGTPRSDGVGHARHWRSTAMGAAALATSLVTLAPAARAVARPSTPPLRRACADGAPAGVAGAVLRIRRGAVLQLRRTRPQDIAARRRAGFMRLSALYRDALCRDHPAAPTEAADGISDLQFTDAYRVPFQYSRFVRQHLPAGAFVQSSDGVTRHRPRRQPLLRPHRLLRRQPVSATTSTRSASSAAPSACARSARCSAPIIR